MELRSVLEEFGLTNNEASVYVALIQAGPSSVLNIARRTDLKRPTIYLILDELIKKSFVAIVPQEKKRRFLALPPDRFLEKLETQMYSLKKALPEFNALYRSKSARPKVRLLEGKEGIITVYKEIYNYPHRAEVLSFYSTELVPQEINDLFINLFKNRRVAGREVTFTKGINPSYVKYMEKLKNVPTYKIRFIREPIKFFTDNVIYGNNVAIFSFAKLFALTIESDDVANTFRSLFDLAWQSSKPIV